ncbi:hypothetical protein EfsSVR2331_25380 [Enterococcus faecalis]|nr:hypothetical protein EfsSVR2331_25380 [Enterococcus faecalis]
MEIIYPPLVEEGLKYYLETTQQSLDKSTFLSFNGRERNYY